MPDVESIIASSLSDLKDSGEVTMDPGDENTVEASADTGAAEPQAVEIPSADVVVPEAAAATPPAEPVKAAEPDEETELKAIEAELVGKTPGLARGKLTQSRHQAVVTRIRRAGEAEVAKIKDQYKQFDDPVVARRLEGATWAETNPELFVREVVMKHPAYKPAIDKILEENRAAAPAAVVSATSAAAPVSVPDVAPEPDEVGPDGSLRYSLDGQRALARYEAAQMTKDLRGTLERLQGDMKPVLTERQAAERNREVSTRMASYLADAEASWDGFKEHRAEIQALMLKPGNERLKLDEAYRQVVLPKYKADAAKIEADIRAKISKELAEAKGAPNRLSANGQAPAIAAAAGQPKDTESIIRDELRKMRGANV